MPPLIPSSAPTPDVHPWLRQIRVAYVPGPGSALLEQVVPSLLGSFAQAGHTVQDRPDDTTDVVLTAAPFGEPLDWRKAALFTSRRKFGLTRTPTVFTLVSCTPEQFRTALDALARALDEDDPDPRDLTFPGLAADARHVLLEQGRRGGPILALERVVQAQAKSIRVVLIVGEEQPLEAYHFDLVGAYPRSDGSSPELFYTDIVHRIATAICTRPVSDHQVAGTPLRRDLWERLEAPSAMRTAGIQLGERGLFTDMIVIGHLTAVPAVGDAVASQYSEGCFATWEPAIPGLVTTVTGSARPVHKGQLTDDDLAVVVGVRPDGTGALVRHVEGSRNDPPSSEAVELASIDLPLPSVRLDAGRADGLTVPVARSKLHVHRSVSMYDPDRVEYAPMDRVYHNYLVSCGTDAQAEGITKAFSQAEALRGPMDSRQVVFTILPGHGAVILEKWVPGKAPFEVIWQYLDAGHLVISTTIPQGPHSFEVGAMGQMVMIEREPAPQS